MIGIKVAGGFLDLRPDVAFTFELHSPMYLGEEADVIKGSYSFPVDLPASSNNLVRLGHLTRIDVAGATLENACEIWYQGKFLWSGKIVSKGSTRRTLRMFVLISNQEELRQRALNEIDLGGDRMPEASVEDLLAHAKDTAENPLDRDYIFFPVRNFSFFAGNENDPGTLASQYQNHYDRTAQAFVSAGDQQNAMPFVRVDYALARILTAVGYTVDNQFQNVNELKKLCLYNNYSIYKENIWGLTFNLRNHVSKTPLNEFLKSLNKTFALGIFFNDPDGVAEIIPIKDLIQRGHVYDWTSKASGEYSQEFTNYEINLSHAEDSNDDLEAYRNFQEPIVGEILSLYVPYSAPPGDGYYYITSNGSIHYRHSTEGDGVNQGEKRYEHKTSDAAERTIESMAPLYMIQVFDPSDLSFFYDWFAPEIKCAGTHPEYKMRNEFSDRLVFYRGMYDDRDGRDYPMASNNVYDIHPYPPFGDGLPGAIADYSLLWNGEYGLYEKWWKPVIEMLRNKKVVTYDLNVHITDIINFRFQDKIRIRNMNYFTQKLRITFRGSRMVVQGVFCSTV